MQKNENSLIRRPPKFMQILAILAIFRISTIYLTNLPLINFGLLNLHMDAKIHKKFMSEFHPVVFPKLGLENIPKFGGCLSHEFAFFGNFFFA